jgi:hypothetical protein
MSFEQGWIPSGWKRGEPVQIQNPPPNGYGVLSTFPKFIGVDGEVPVDLVMVKFHESEIPEVNAWLRWWRDGN